VFPSLPGGSLVIGAERCREALQRYSEMASEVLVKSQKQTAAYGR